MYGEFVLINQVATDQFLKLLGYLFIHIYDRFLTNKLFWLILSRFLSDACRINSADVLGIVTLHIRSQEQGLHAHISHFNL